MTLDATRSPLAFLQQMLGTVPCEAALREYEGWWEAEGRAISDAVDRGGTPWLRMFDRFGRRVDEICYPPEYWKMLRRGYQAGVLWRAFGERSLLPAYLLIYATAFYDPGLACPYTVSLATAVALEKYATPELKQKFLEPMLRQDGSGWQGATWMTEIKGGSDLGAGVETVAVPQHGRWSLSGDKYFASNVGAEAAIVAARPNGAARDVRGLALYLVPRLRPNGELNYCVRRLKNKIATRSVPTGEVELRESEAYRLGPEGGGIYLILEALNVSRIANSMGSVGLAQRALADALEFARGRVAFGKPVIEHPLLRQQFEERGQKLRAAFALAWEAVRLLDEVWQEQPPYSERYHLFRLMAHLAKYWTAEVAAQTAKWAMEAHGGLGVLAEYRVERWLREAMILAIWEGTAHRQILDGWEVIQRKRAHQPLLKRLEQIAPSPELSRVEAEIGACLQRPQAEQEAAAEALFAALADLTAKSCLLRYST